MRGFFTTRRSTDRPRSAFTQIELVVSLIAASILMVGMMSAVAIAGKAVAPPPGSKTTLDAGKLTQLLSSELQSAWLVAEEGAALTFTVHDRDADLSPETIRYAWDADQHVLTRTYNGESGQLANDIEAFSLSTEYQSRTEVLGGLATTSATAVLAEHVSGANVTRHDIDPQTPIGQAISIVHPVGTTSWNITSIELPLYRNSKANAFENIVVELRTFTEAGMPTSEVLGDEVVSVAALPPYLDGIAPSVTTVNLAVEHLPPDLLVGVVIRTDSSTPGSGATVLSTTPTVSGDLLVNTDSAGSWRLQPATRVLFRVNGSQTVLDSSTHAVQRWFLTAVTADMAFSDQPELLRRRIRLQNAPEAVTNYWLLNFDADPVTVDHDADGTFDWTSPSSSLNSPQNGRLEVDAGDSFAGVTADFEGLVTVEVDVSAEEVGATGWVSIPFGADDSDFGRLRLEITRDSDTTQTASLAAFTGSSFETLAKVSNLPSQIIGFRIVIDPATNNAAWWVNGRSHGRYSVDQDATTGSRAIEFGADAASAMFDFLSVRIGSVR